MPRGPVDNFGCRRCDTWCHVGADGVLPRGWEHWSNEEGRSFDLCPSCVEALALWLRGQEARLN